MVEQDQFQQCLPEVVKHIDCANALRRIESAKRKARSELRLPDWQKHNFMHNSYVTNEILNIESAKAKDGLQRVDINNIRKEDFAKQFEHTYTPCVLTGAIDGWKAKQDKAWSPLGLLQSIGDFRFKCGEDDDGDAVKVRMKYFLWYMLANTDDSPLYVFDGSFDRRIRSKDRDKRDKGGPIEGGKNLLDDYTVPTLFKDDLFNYAGERKRPPYRWFVLGPCRSGTGIHQDPLGTSAWNALVYGHKRWVFFPPGTLKETVKPADRVGDKEAITWFHNVYPLTQRPDWTGPKPLECLQRPGETMFVPGGWWHVVLNVGWTSAVTQNFASEANFPLVWKRTLKARPVLSRKWLNSLRRRRPDIAAIAENVTRGTFDFAPYVQTEENARQWLLTYESSCSSSSSSSDWTTTDEETDNSRTNKGNRDSVSREDSSERPEKRRATPPSNPTVMHTNEAPGTAATGRTGITGAPPQLQHNGFPMGAAPTRPVIPGNGFPAYGAQPHFSTSNGHAHPQFVPAAHSYY